MIISNDDRKVKERSHSKLKRSVLECKICFEEFNTKVKEPLVLKCGHTFCSQCIKTIGSETING